MVDSASIAVNRRYRRAKTDRLDTTKRDRTRVRNRIKGLLAGYGIRMALQGEVETELEEVRPWDGTPLPAALRARLQREWQKVQGLTEQITLREAERRAEV